MQRVIVTGANGQIGSDLITLLRKQLGDENVMGLDLRDPVGKIAGGPHVTADVTDRARMEAVADKYECDTVFHLASLLSATVEKKPDLAWHVNMEGLKNILDMAARRNWKVFWPSSIAVFGPTTPKEKTPQSTILEPTTMYGITKRAGELLCQYYHARFGVDVRGIRYPGLISYTTPPGGGTTDYAIEMLRAAVEGVPYTCFVAADTRLPMMYMPDAIQASLDLMQAPANAIRVRGGYNVEGVSFSAGRTGSRKSKRYCLPLHVPTYRISDRKLLKPGRLLLTIQQPRETGDGGRNTTRRRMVQDMLTHLRERLPRPESLPFPDSITQTHARRCNFPFSI